MRDDAITPPVGPQRTAAERKGRTVDFAWNNRAGLSDMGEKVWGLGVSVHRSYEDAAPLTANDSNWQPDGWVVMVELGPWTFGWASNPVVATEYGIGDWA